MSLDPEIKPPSPCLTRPPPAPHSYAELITTSEAVSRSLAGLPARTPTVAFPPAAAAQPRVALAAEPGLAYAAGTLGTWLARGIAVPLCLSHPDRELAYTLADAGASAVLATPAQAARARALAEPLGAQVVELPAEGGAGAAAVAAVEAATAALSPAAGALIIYTSGTTGRPKGALHTLASVDAQVATMVAAWGWTPRDRLLHALPLHHVHGIVNALYTPLAVGAAVEMLPKFSPTEVWARLTRAAPDPVTVFMGVPTMYSFLLNAAEDGGVPEAERAARTAAARRLRLAVSGSAACPLPTLHGWRRLAGTYPLERYGMTETGMVLGNPLEGERHPGTVGTPFPGMAARVDPATGELLVRGPQLFAGYWGRPEATVAVFDAGGFFLTGDTVEVVEDPAEVGAHGYYRILGRTSVDIIKTGGFKVSALEVESALLEHPALAEAAVVGLPDPHYGEIVAVVAALRPGAPGLTLAALTEFGRHRLAPYQLPRILRLVLALPRNAMGKINKKALRAEMFPDLFPPAGPAA